MTGVLIGFAIIAVVIAAGYLAGRAGVLGDQGQYVLNRAAFFVFVPCLLLTVLADADIRLLFSSVLMVSAIAFALSAFTYVLIARLAWKRSIAELTVGALGAANVNGNNIGIPVAVYVIGDAAFSAPVVLMQLILVTPIALTLLDVQSRGSVSWRTVVLAPLRNPLIIGSAIGVILAATGLPVPDAVMEPFRIIGAAGVPISLVAYGVSLHGQRPLRSAQSRKDVLLASAIKLALMPALAWVFAHFVFHLEPHYVFGVVMLAALPTAQMVFNYAQRYDTAVAMARDVVLITTVGSLPVAFAIAGLLKA